MRVVTRDAPEPKHVKKQVGRSDLQDLLNTVNGIDLTKGKEDLERRKHKLETKLHELLKNA